MMAQPLLTIGIPTWNRSRFLLRLLDQVTGQIEGGKLAGVEVLVNDNASDDDTRRMMGAYVKRHPSVRYARNPVNVRLGGNVVKVVERARGKYLWFIGDDDLIEPDAVKAVLGLARRGEKTIFFMNTRLPDGRLEYYRRLPEGDHRLELGDALSRSHLADLGLISNLIAPVAEMQQTTRRFKELNRIWPHLNVAFLTAINQRCHLCLSNRALTKYTGDNDPGYIGTEPLRIFAEGYFDLIADVERQSGKRLGRLRHAGIRREVFEMAYLSSAFSGKYWKDLGYVARLNRKMRSAKLLLLSLPFLLPRPLRRLLLFLGARAIGKGAAYEEYHKKATSQSASKSSRRVISDGNL